MVEEGGRGDAIGRRLPQLLRIFSVVDKLPCQLKGMVSERRGVHGGGGAGWREADSEDKGIEGGRGRGETGRKVSR